METQSKTSDRQATNVNICKPQFNNNPVVSLVSPTQGSSWRRIVGYQQSKKGYVFHSDNHRICDCNKP
jgi:hypothetical protein